MLFQSFLSFWRRGSNAYLVSILAGALLGVVLNVGGAGETLSSLLTLPGPMFIRALQCAVIPMMFFNIVVSVIKIYSDGTGGVLGKRVALYYLLTTVMACSTGVISANIFASLFVLNDDGDDDGGAEVVLSCPEGFGDMTMLEDGSVLCLSDDGLSVRNLTDENQKFHLQDEDNILMNDALVERTLAEQVLGTFESLFPNNVVQSFGLPNIISVIVIAFVFAASIMYLNEEESQYASGSIDGSADEEKFPLNKASAGGEKDSSDYQAEKRSAAYIYRICQEMTWITNVIIGWIIGYAPICVGFLIAMSLATAGGLVDLLTSVGVYCLSTIFGLFVHASISLPAMYYYFTKENPYQYLYSCRQAPILAFSTASSAATLPITIENVVKSKKVKSSTANVVLPMGANVNMDGTAIGFPCMIMFLAYSANLEGSISAFTWVNVAIASSLGSVGAAPVPSAGIVTTITVWQTAFPRDEVPSAISYVQAIDFFLDRCRTCVNVISDIFVVGMLQDVLDKETGASENIRKSIELSDRV